MSIDPLFTPFTIKNLTLRNRIISTPHEPAYSEDGLAKDRYRAYHVEKAKGGVSLTMTAGSALVSRSSAPAFGNLQLWKDETVPWLRRLTDEVHDHGTAVMIQLSHMGQRQSNYLHEWMPSVSASAVREPSHRAYTKAAEQFDMDQIKDDYVSAAQKMVEAGMDGIELMLYGHYLDSFITPFWNHRDDQYGGSFENRMKYPLEVIQAIRAAVPNDFIVGVRMSFDEERTRGLDFDDSIRVGQLYVENGIDFIDAVKGSIETDFRLAKMIPVMGMASAPQLEMAGEAKRKLDVPFIHAAKIADVPTARYAIEAGLIDLVGMTRALMADPYLPQKISSGREDEIRPCVGASMCIDGIYTNGAAFCIHNPATGRELHIPQLVEPTEAKKKVAIVGGGPAGLEAARVSAERGHDVTLFEASDRLGGQLVIAAMSPRRRDLQGIVDWRTQELKRLGVTVKLNAYVEVSELTSENWDAVIVATGGLPLSLEFPGSQHVIESWDVLSGAKRLTGSVLVFDDHGGNQALDAVEAILRQGGSVELVTPDRMVSPEVGGLIASQYFNALSREGVRITLLRQLKSIEKNSDGTFTVTLGLDQDSWTETRVVDAVVVDAGTYAVADVYDELIPVSSNEGGYNINDFIDRKPQNHVRNPYGTFVLYRIGDAVASRNVHAAMLDATRAAYAI